MAAFIAKQLVGDQLKSVKGAMGEEKKEGEGGGAEKGEMTEEEREHAEALREEDERRKNKHKKMEEEREKMRQEIRDKYGLKKQLPPDPMAPDPGLEGRLGRKKKTPAEMAAEEAAAQEAENSPIPKELLDLKDKLGDPSKMVAEVAGKCVLQ